MPIFGLGTDIVRVSRIARILANSKLEARFCRKVLHPNELEQYAAYPSLQRKAEFVATRWAAKEACVKASGITSLIFPGICIERGKGGRPGIRWEGDNEQKIGLLGVARTHVSLSHEEEYAVASVILEE